ncbi:hypothetical protein J437_LFUL014108 [Ladona fulva]|uniref:Selenoprotein P N-terminal domain-containing protein n=1 Tax=Ladona fulva TaxID=123851 RepID=A0A8K0KFP3_LADFU|nr:hypothetical protein J437_LFUL014108 [Ladona fulva]
MVIINAGSSAHAGLALQAAARAVPVLQDNDILSPSIWELMGAAKDDIMVFDRCGHLTYHVIMPWSLLTYPYVKAAVLSTYHDKPCGPCNRTSVSHHHDQHQANGESEQSAVNASYAEQLLMAEAWKKALRPSASALVIFILSAVSVLSSSPPSGVYQCEKAPYWSAPYVGGRRSLSSDDFNGKVTLLAMLDAT